GGLEAVYAFGGGIFVDMGSAQNLNVPYVFTNLTFRNNRAVASPVPANTAAGARAAGGAVALRYVVNSTFQNDVFDSNQAIGSDGAAAGGSGIGGAIHVDHSNMVGNDLTFQNNLAKSGGTPGGNGRDTTANPASGIGELADALGG